MQLPTVGGRLAILDALRGIAIALVVWYHLWLVTGFSLPGFGIFDVFARGGFLGVDLFFFVSGFCIGFPYARRRAEGKPVPTLREFARKRALKILPSYALALVVFGFLFRARFAGPFDEVRQFVAHLTFVHVFSSTTFGSFSGPLWTLGVEVQFYVVFALFAGFVSRRPISAYALTVAFAVTYRFAISRAGLDTDFGWINQLPAVLDVFGAGVLGAFGFVALEGRARPVDERGATALALIGASLAIVGFVAADLAAKAGGDDGVRRWLDLWRFAFGPVLLATTLGLLASPLAVRRLAAPAALAWLSGVSYNAYLWNLEIVVGLRATGLPPGVVFCLAAALTLAVGALITYGFERPIVRGMWPDYRFSAVASAASKSTGFSIHGQ